MLQVKWPGAAEKRAVHSKWDADRNGRSGCDLEPGWNDNTGRKSRLRWLPKGGRGSVNVGHTQSFSWRGPVDR